MLPIFIKININIILTEKKLNCHTVTMQTHGYDQLLRFPKTVKSINSLNLLPVHFNNDLKTVTGSRPTKRSNSVTNV